MCGRYAVSNRAMREIEAQLGLNLTEEGVNPNVTPSGTAPVVGIFDGKMAVRTMKWGLVPHWSAEPVVKYSTINARVETAAQKPAYRESMKRGRILVPADGFYEWRPEGGKKIPYYFTPAQKGGFAFAGLMDRWQKGGEALETFTILVGEPNPLLAAYHDRMPAILPPEAYAKWLNPQTPVAEALALASTLFPAEMMKVEQLGPPRSR